MPINIFKVYCDLALTLYIKGSVFKAVVAVFVIFIAVNKWLKALLASFVLIEVALLNISSLKVVK